MESTTSSSPSENPLPLKTIEPNPATETTSQTVNTMAGSRKRAASEGTPASPVHKKHKGCDASENAPASPSPKEVKDSAASENALASPSPKEVKDSDAPGPKLKESQPVTNKQSNITMSTSEGTLLSVEERFLYLSEDLHRVESGEISKESFRRHLKLSNIASVTLAETISGAIDEISYCNSPDKENRYLLHPLWRDPLEIIAECQRIQKIRDEHIRDGPFPFLQLTPEIRNKIYQLVLLNKENAYDKQLLSREEKPLITTRREFTCNDALCVKRKKPHLVGREGRNSKPVAGITILQVNRFIRAEAMPLFYQSHQFVFTCCNNLLNHAGSNIAFQNNVESIKIFWNGIKADEAFAALKKCTALKHLDINVSVHATDFKSKRETMRMKYWPCGKRTAILDALGMDELLCLSGLKRVEVENWSWSNKKLGDDKFVSKWEKDMRGLHMLLNDKLLMPEEE